MSAPPKYGRLARLLAPVIAVGLVILPTSGVAVAEPDSDLTTTVSTVAPSPVTPTPEQVPESPSNTVSSIEAPVPTQSSSTVQSTQESSSPSTASPVTTEPSPSETSSASTSLAPEPEATVTDSVGQSSTNLERHHDPRSSEVTTTESTSSNHDSSTSHTRTRDSSPVSSTTTTTTAETPPPPRIPPRDHWKPPVVGNPAEYHPDRPDNQWPHDVPAPGNVHFDVHASLWFSLGVQDRDNERGRVILPPPSDYRDGDQLVYYFRSKVDSTVRVIQVDRDHPAVVDWCVKGDYFFSAAKRQSNGSFQTVGGGTFSIGDGCYTGRDVPPRGYHPPPPPPPPQVTIINITNNYYYGNVIIPVKVVKIDDRHYQYGNNILNVTPQSDGTHHLDNFVQDIGTGGKVCEPDQLALADIALQGNQEHQFFWTPLELAGAALGALVVAAVVVGAYAFGKRGTPQH